MSTHSHRRPAPRAARAVAAGLFALGGLVALAAACSLGDGVTPECDPSLAPGQDGACQGVANCDDGRGGVLATEGCCIEASRQLLEICVQRQVSDDWRVECQPNAQLAGAVCTVTTGEMDDKTPNVDVNNATPACDMANDVFAHCLAGGLEFSGGTGGGGTGGMGTGGMGTGGMGTGGMGTGGAGGG
ncbi:MAG: hypothetical protein RIF41_24155 [Polyangiaceae bacterium]